jgi:pimeloyl-ACP methyl ester carboxylesterase
MNVASVVYRERTLTAQDGLKLYYREYGDDHTGHTPVICLAGVARNSKDFHELALHLCSQRRVLCPDYRGRGKSEWDSDYRNYRPEVHLSDLVHLMTAAQIHRAVIVGTSYGGLLAMGLGVIQPTCLAGVVLNDVGPEISDSGADRISGYIGKDVRHPDWAAAAAATKAQFGAAFPDADDDSWMDSARRMYVEDGEGQLRLDYDLALGKALQEQSGNVPDLWPVYGSLRHIPVLAIRGALSDVLSENTFARMAEIKPDLVQVTVNNIGHAPMLDEPECLKAIDEFLKPL